MRRFHVLMFAGLCTLGLCMPGLCAAGAAQAAEPATPSDPQPAPGLDAELARRTGADDYGMRRYVLVILRTGPTPAKDEAARKAMFAGHMANMDRLAREGKLALAGPFGDAGGDWRGLFVFAVNDIDEAKALTATDPVIQQGEMVAEYHLWYGSAATMLISELHGKLARKAF